MPEELSPPCILNPSESTTGADDRRSYNVFSLSMVFSGLRCLFSYVLVPFVTPFLSLGLRAAIGLPLGVFAIFFDLFALRRFYKSKNKYRLYISLIYAGIIGLLVVLVIRDILNLF
jgi:hypothetical protein